jgi:hypothetical protein
MPIRWLHPDSEGCVAFMVLPSIMTVQQQKDGGRELIIVDPPDNDDLVAAQVDRCAFAGDEDNGVWDDSDEDEGELVDHAHDESMVSGLMGMIGITLFDEEF